MFTRKRLAALAGIALLVVVAGCSSSHKSSPAPTPSPSLGGNPLAVATDAGPFRSGPVHAPAKGALVGAWVKPDELTNVGREMASDALEQNLGRKLPIVNTYRRFDQTVGTESDQEFLAAGATLMISWATGDNREILDHEDDDMIRKEALSIKAVKKPVLLRMRWEMDRPNLRPTMWSGADYIAAWKYVRTIFNQEGATNVSWVWCPTAEGFQGDGDAADFYPGDDQVDWTCVDVYAGAHYAPIGQLMHGFLQFAAKHPKPIIIGEFGVAKAWGSAARAGWLTDASRTFKANPQIKAVAYFESDPDGAKPNKQFQLTGDALAFKAFHTLVTDPYFNP